MAFVELVLQIFLRQVPHRHNNQLVPLGDNLSQNREKSKEELEKERIDQVKEKLATKLKEMDCSDYFRACMSISCKPSSSGNSGSMIKSSNVIR